MGKWLELHGDQLATFVALASIALKGLDDLPAWASQIITIVSVLATAAHQSFFQLPAEPAQEIRK